jgi:murein DD-endopeptidase MepM/ murein hydrolase activator NlpD
LPTHSRSGVEIFINNNVDASQYANDSAKHGPAKGKVVNPKKGHYGKVRFNGRVVHPGIDIKGQMDDPVVAYSEGRVARIVEGHKDAGNFIVLEHERKVYDEEKGVYRKEIYVSRYLHLNEIKVNKGDRIKEGQEIGTMGNTGNCGDYDPHLHFEIRKLKEGVNANEARKAGFINRYTRHVDPVKDLKTNQSFISKVKERFSNIISNIKKKDN